MANLADLIEDFIKDMFSRIPGGILDIQRNEMANRFGCAPSQINYVLTTRFTLERGYFVESRRGGGGYIRIRKLKIREDEFLKEIIDYIGDSISGSEARALITRLREEKVISEREKEILNAVINRYNLGIPLPERDRLRARILKSVITAIMDYEARKGGELS
ncbi:MAG: transcriptional regulator of stress and heat shock response [Tepidanaerobacteraceae bacterium]|nr:transcriptional regulator of stress and heat shock response [Tepidanaerobacteraceae bacterium]